MYDNEEEIMLARNLLFEFKSHTKSNDGYDIIEIDIIKKAPLWKKIHEFWKEVF